jgi:dihydroxyacetone kinase-like predicted kinase
MTTEAHISGQELFAAAATALKERVEEVNRLNVFPVPDGDTGTNMSLTMDAVLDDLAKLAPVATPASSSARCCAGCARSPAAPRRSHPTP